MRSPSFKSKWMPPIQCLGIDGVRSPSSVLPMRATHLQRGYGPPYARNKRSSDGNGEKNFRAHGHNVCVKSPNFAILPMSDSVWTHVEAGSPLRNYQSRACSQLLVQLRAPDIGWCASGAGKTRVALHVAAALKLPIEVRYPPPHWLNNGKNALTG